MSNIVDMEGMSLSTIDDTNHIPPRYNYLKASGFYVPLIKVWGDKSCCRMMGEWNQNQALMEDRLRRDQRISILMYAKRGLIMVS